MKSRIKLLLEDRIKLLLDNPDRVEREPWKNDPKVFDGFLQHCLRTVGATPTAAIDPIKSAIWLSPQPCQRAMAWGLLSFAHNALQESSEALGAVQSLFTARGNCSACRPESHRFRAIVRKSAGDLAGGLEDATVAVDGYRELGHPGHNLQGNGLASSLNARAGIYLEMEDHAAAMADLREALGALNPKVSPKLCRIVVHNLARCLVLTGKRSALREAERYLTKALRLFKGAKRDSQEHAKLLWTAALIRHQLAAAMPAAGRPTRYAASEQRRYMRRAAACFLRLGMHLEAVAVIADLARMCWHLRDYTRHIGEGLAVIAGQVKRDKVGSDVAAALLEVTREIGQTPQDAWRRQGNGTLKRKIEALRDACVGADEKGSRVLACLVTFRPRQRGRLSRTGGLLHAAVEMQTCPESNKKSRHVV